MAPLGPFGRRPSPAVAVSGGADSLALCLLAEAWARARGGAVRGLIVDHGVRAASAGEAEITRQLLARRGIGAAILPLRGLTPGPGLAARARAARYAALAAACAAEGLIDLLLGHHASDQAETAAMRRLAGSLPDGMAAMPALAEREHVRLLRPLLAIPPGRLRATLAALGEAWVEDPSNADPAAQRARLRALARDREGCGPVTRASVAAAAARGRARAARERATAAVLARRVRLAPEGFAVVTPGALPPEVLAALLRTLSGRAFAPAPERVAALAAALHPATLGGVQVLPAGRLQRGGWLLVREPAAVAPPMACADGALWDGRFRVQAARLPAQAEIGAPGLDADLPASVRRGLPAIRVCGKLAEGVRVGYADDSGRAAVCVMFVPSVPLVAAPFLAPRQAAGTTAGGSRRAGELQPG